LYEGNSLVLIAMRKKEITHEFRIRNGGHTWTYWREALPPVLKFVLGAFRQYWQIAQCQWGKKERYSVIDNRSFFCHRPKFYFCRPFGM